MPHHASGGRHPDLRSERGIALVVAIVALVVIGAIVAGTFFLSTVEQRTAQNTVEAAQAFQAAEAGLQVAISSWDPADNALPTDASRRLARDSVAPSVYYDVTISRLNDNLFDVRSVGTRRRATQTLAETLRLMRASPVVEAALTTPGPVSAAANAAIAGINTPPSGWSDCPPGADKAGARSGSTVSESGGATIQGVPAGVQHDGSASAARTQAAFDQLRPLATLELPGGLYGAAAPRLGGPPSTCDRADPRNWGEPLREPMAGALAPCAAYAPVVLIDGSAAIESGRGQGVLLVTGDLDIGANVDYVGLIVVRGRVTLHGSGSRITGGILAGGGPSGDAASLTGPVTLSYSRCALDYVLRQGAVARPVVGRAWAQVF